ncbi:hypothetical protein ACFX2A_025119 [Malus domestica]
MAKVPTIPFLLLRRWYKAAAESVRGQKAAATTVRTRTTESGSRTVNNTAANYATKGSVLDEKPEHGELDSGDSF